MARRRIDKSEYHEEISPQDEVLLNEFFSLVARIAIRLTSKDTNDNNVIAPSKQEADKQ
jgi:hypothetical protein